MGLLSRFVKPTEPTSTALVDDSPTRDIEKELPAAHLDEQAHHHVDPIIEKRVVKKLDWNVVPVSRPVPQKLDSTDFLVARSCSLYAL
jgi:hypothetical protein